MNVTFAYLGRSTLADAGPNRVLRLAPNLARGAVAFDAALKSPLRFREAISALHDVVISDLRYKPRDKTAYLEWKRQEGERLAALRRQEYKQAREEILARRGEVPADLERQYHVRLRQYWGARQRYADYLRRHDQELWRMLMPCDPVITVAQDVVFFECFSADESSYGCLTANRDDCFGRAESMQPGTTNVDYSWQLYHYFQSLRSYRDTRLHVDPGGFQVQTQGHPDYREEKIDLPAGWLRGFMQIQGAMSLPMRRVSLSREAVYSLLAWLRRHKARTSPRALRFELLPGQPPSLVLEPWEQRIVSHGTTYQGPEGEPVRVWGRQRLLMLARLLPLVERFDVYLLGTGLPSFWVGQMGDMRLTVGLSGWTANDWTRGSALDLLAPPVTPAKGVVDRVAGFLNQRQAADFEAIRSNVLVDPPTCAAALKHLAHAGQVIYDLDAGVYRWRQVMPRALGEAEMGPEDPESKAARELVGRGKVKIKSQQEGPGNTRLFTGYIDGTPIELLIDADGAIRRGKCTCSHHYQYGLRRGPCRHLLALRAVATSLPGAAEAPGQNWYTRLQQWANN
jgi:hypothetical protein